MIESKCRECKNAFGIAIEKEDGKGVLDAFETMPKSCLDRVSPPVIESAIGVLFNGQVSQREICNLAEVLEKKHSFSQKMLLEHCIMQYLKGNDNYSFAIDAMKKYYEMTGDWSMHTEALVLAVLKDGTSCQREELDKILHNGSYLGGS